MDRDDVGDEGVGAGVELEDDAVNSVGGNELDCGGGPAAEGGGGPVESERHIRMKELTTGREEEAVGAEAERNRVDLEDTAGRGSVKINWGVFKSTGVSAWSSGSRSATSSVALREAPRLKLQEMLTAR